MNGKSLILLFLFSSVALAAEPEIFKVDKQYPKRREAMVQELKDRGVTDPHIQNALGAVPREKFVRPGLKFRAYFHEKVAVEKRLFLSKPMDWAHALELLKIPENGRVLVIDPGIGYSGALLAQMVRETYVVVTDPELQQFVQERYGSLYYRGLYVKPGSLTEGWPKRAPFDRILIAGAVSFSQPPTALLDQMGTKGILLVPEGGAYQHFARYVKTGNDVTRTEHFECEFPPI